MRKLVIVCEEDTRKYGDFLAQLVSLKDDKNGEVVGTKDGEVAAQVWTEKDYSSNAAQISSEQYILFIGNSKLIEEKRSHMPIVFSEYGMSYGWLGKQASLFVKDVLDTKDYDAFIDYALGIRPEAENYIKRIEGINKPVEAIEDKKEETAPVEEKGNDFFGGLFNKAMKAVASVPGMVGDFVDKQETDKKIKDQQYTCAVLHFYIRGLSSFLDLNAEA